MLLHNSLAGGSSSKLLYFHDSKPFFDFCLLKPHGRKLASSNLTRLLGQEEQTTQLAFLRCTFETLPLLGLGNIFHVKPQNDKAPSQKSICQGQEQFCTPGTGSASETTS